MKQRGRELDSWTEIVEKAVDAKAQASLQPTFYIKKMDQQCLRGNRPTFTNASTQSNLIRDSRMEESQSKLQEPKVSARQHQAEASGEVRKVKKKRWKTNNLAKTDSKKALPPPPESTQQSQVSKVKRTKIRTEIVQTGWHVT